jgi:hypothetical protein
MDTNNAPSTMLRMVPLPRSAGEEPKSRPATTLILLRLWRSGIAEGGGGGISHQLAKGGFAWAR